MFDVLGNKMLINIHCYFCFILESKCRNEKKKVIQQQTTPLALAASMNYKKCAVDFSTLRCTCRYQCMKNKDHFN